MIGWYVCRLDADQAQARLRDAAELHGFEAPRGEPRLVWLGLRGGGFLADAAVVGDRARLPLPPNLLATRPPTAGAVRRDPAAERYAPFWIIGAGVDAAVVSGVDGRLAGSVPIDQGRAGRALVALCVPLLCALLIGLEVIDALMTIGVLWPISTLFAGEPRTAQGLALCLACFGSLYWFGRRSLDRARPLIEEAAARVTTGRVDLGRPYARPTIIWVIGALSLFVALRVGVNLVTGEVSGWAWLPGVATIGSALVLARAAHRSGRRPRESSPWVGARSGTGSPIVVQWAHLSLRIAVFGVSTWFLALMLGATEVVHHLGLWVLDLGPGVEANAMTVGVALGMWTHRRRWRWRPAREVVSLEPVVERAPVSASAQRPERGSGAEPVVLLAPLSLTRGASNEHPAPAAAPPEPPRRRLVGSLSTAPLESAAASGSPAPEEVSSSTEAPPRAASESDTFAPSDTSDPDRPGAAPDAQAAPVEEAARDGRRLPVGALLVMMGGAQIGALLSMALSALGSGLAAAGMLWLGRLGRGLSTRQRLMLLGSVVAAGAAGRLIGQLCGMFLAGGLGAEAGSEIGEWTVTSAALAVALSPAALEPPTSDVAPPAPSPADNGPPLAHR